MGWKASFIIIDSNKEIEEKELLKNVGFNRLRATRKVDFSVAMNPKKNQVYFGRYNGRIIICEERLPETFMKRKETTVEMVLAHYFPDTEICSLILNSVTNYWGYSISKNNKKKRIRSGDTEEGLIIDFGTPLKEEEPLLDQLKIDEKGKRLFYLEGHADALTEDQVGESFVFKIAKRYFGEELDRADDLLFETEFQGYEKIDRLAEEVAEINRSKKRKKRIVLLLLFLIIIWQVLTFVLK